MTTYNLKCTVYLNGRSAPNGAINFPAGATLTTGFKPNDILTADQYTIDANGITKWYRITGCSRNGVSISIPNPVYASDGGSLAYLVLQAPPPVVEFPTSIWVSLTETGERKEYVLV